jgi:uncharacterized phage protein (TIGR01671 family)
MRDIKFRAWDKYSKYMFELDDKDFFVNNNGVYERESIDYAGDVYNNISDRLILMQYTGLKDKNGVEIYEGDLVIGTGKINPYPIIFDDGCFGYDSGEGLLELDFERHMEVIGNIHQHPDLLNKS